MASLAICLLLFSAFYTHLSNSPRNLRLGYEDDLPVYRWGNWCKEKLVRGPRSHGKLVVELDFKMKFSLGLKNTCIILSVVLRNSTCNLAVTSKLKEVGLTSDLSVEILKHEPRTTHQTILSTLCKSRKQESNSTIGINE